MKTVTIRPDQAQLMELIDQVYRDSPIVLSYGDKRVSVQRYDPVPLDDGIDLEDDSPELEAELLKASNGPFQPYTPADLLAIVERVQREQAKE
jgi:hypothetical protein